MTPQMALAAARQAVQRIRTLEDEGEALAAKWPEDSDPPADVVQHMIQITYTIAEVASDLADAHEILDAACELQERPARRWLSRLFGGG